MKLGMGLIGTIAALVLGLLVASAKSSFDTQQSEFVQMSANIIFLDRVLAHYGAEATQARDMLKGAVVNMLDRIWPTDRSHPARVEGTTSSEALYEKLQELAPKSESQHALKAQALKTATDIAQMRWLLFAHRGSSIPVVFLVVVSCWLTLIFAGFSLFAPPNATVIVTLLISALSVAGAIFLILELDRPFEGMIQISSGPMRDALAQLGR